MEDLFVRWPHGQDYARCPYIWILQRSWVKLNLELWKTVAVEENKGDGHSRREAWNPEHLNIERGGSRQGRLIT